MRLPHNAELADAIKLTGRFTFNPKEGIDNPAMIDTDDSEPVRSPTPRVCVLKREEDKSFGFHLRVERGCRGHIIRQVEPLAVAAKSGLRDGDRLLEVNEVFVNNMEHSEVTRRIIMGGSQLCFLVLDEEEYMRAVSQGHDLQELARGHRGEGWRSPRLCHITKEGNATLGLNILPVEGEKGKFKASPAKGGPAERSGVRKGDRIIWIDGAMVSDLTHSAISKMVKKCDGGMSMLVIDSEGEQSYASRKMPILPSMAGAHNLPHVARRLHLEQGADGYGLLLRQEKTSSGALVPILWDASNPEKEAGTRLLEVNGESTGSLSHEDIVHRVRESGGKVTLTTITPQGQDFYTKLGLSPLLFCEDVSPAREQQDPSVPEDSPMRLETTVPPTVLQEELQAAPPRSMRCDLLKGPLGFGFHLGFIQQRAGTFISQVAEGGPGEKAGLLHGDVVVEVNGQNVEDKYLEDVILLVKEGGSSLSLLVEREHDRLRSNGTHAGAEMSVSGTETKETLNQPVTE